MVAICCVIMRGVWYSLVRAVARTVPSVPERGKRVAFDIPGDAIQCRYCACSLSEDTSILSEGNLSKAWNQECF